MNKDIWTIILTSSVVAGLVSGAVSGLFNLLIKNLEYANDYYKIVVRRRVDAYEMLENFIGLFRSCVMDVDRFPYHIVFAGEDPQAAIFAATIDMQSKSIWIDKGAFEASQKLNYLLFDVPSDPQDCVEFGKRHYQEIANLRDNLERAVADDMLNIHKVSAFLRTRKRDATGFSAVQLGPRDRPSAHGG